MSIVLLSCALLTLALCWYVLSPRLQEASDQNPHESIDNMRALADQRERCQQVLQDLTLDYQTQKVTESDYNVMRAQVERELSELSDRIHAAKNS